MTADQIDDLRQQVGWERFGKYDQALARSYTHFIVRHESLLIGFLNVISDGVANAFLVDLLILPAFQKKGIGKALIKQAVAELTSDGIQCIQVTFSEELEEFYKKCGFYIFKAGIIDNKAS